MAKCKYNPKTFPTLVRGYAERGLTEEQIAHNLGVSISSFKSYKNKHPPFLAALKAGKAPILFEIEHALYKSAKGFWGPDGKWYPPVTTAQIFSLKNLDKERWRDKHDVEHFGVDGEPITVKILKGASLDDL